MITACGRFYALSHSIYNCVAPFVDLENPSLDIYERYYKRNWHEVHLVDSDIQVPVSQVSCLERLMEQTFR